jgi:hypothetical protein
MTVQWFATSRFAIGDAPERYGSMDPAVYLVHAKSLGTTSSACGQDTSAWKKHWAAFDAVAVEQACPRCVAVVGVQSELSA